MTNTIYVLNGPNLNLLGLREPEIYGSTTLDEIAGMLEDRAAELGLIIDMRQTNHERHAGRLAARGTGRRRRRAVLLNAAAYTHTSIALLDAIKAITTPVIEVHLSDPKKRESRFAIFLISAWPQPIQSRGTAPIPIGLHWKP